MSSAGIMHATAVTKPQATDFQIGEVPIPIELSGSPSRFRTSHKIAPAQANMQASRTNTNPVPGSVEIARKACRTISIENREKHTPAQPNA
jgi:hypothetical protein